MTSESRDTIESARTRLLCWCRLAFSNRFRVDGLFFKVFIIGLFDHVCFCNAKYASSTRASG